MSVLIHDFDKAIDICKNDVTLVGSLYELKIEVDSHVSDGMTINYQGVVVVNGSYITFYGKINNYSTMFTSTMKELNELSAEIKTFIVDGDITETEFSNEVSMVYITGRIASSDSINVDYICSTYKTEDSFMCEMVGVPIEIDDSIIRILVLNKYYHNIIPIKYRDIERVGDVINKTIRFSVDSNYYNQNLEDTPFYIVPVEILENQISEDIIHSTLAEHEIYMNMVMSNGNGNM